MKVISGVFDFDKIQCIIMIDDGGQQNEKQFTEPRTFRIEVIGCKKYFLFRTVSSEILREWTAALYSNWNASASFRIINTEI